MQFPPFPDVPPEDRGTGEHPVRYEDVAQDGRVLCLALPQAIGSVVWKDLLSRSSVTRVLQRQGVVPILTRFVIEGGGGPVSVRRPFQAEGCFQLSHTADEAGAVNRIVLGTWVRVTGKKGRTHGPPPPDAGEPVELGRVFGEHVFTRPFHPPGERKVTRLEAPGIDPVPPARYEWEPMERVAELPPGAAPLDEGLLPDEAPIVFGLHHTDSNQHVNSLVYPRLFEDALLRRVAKHGKRTNLLSRRVEIAYRKPCFAGERVRYHLQAFELDGQLGAVGVLYPDPRPGENGRPHCYMQMLLG